MRQRALAQEKEAPAIRVWDLPCRGTVHGAVAEASGSLLWDPLGPSWILRGGARGTKGYQGDRRSKGHSGESRGTEGDQGGRMGTKEDPGAIDLQVSWGGLVAVM